MVEDVGECRLLAREEIVLLAAVPLGRQLAVGVGEERARGREHAVIAVVRVMRIGREQREAGRGARARGDRARHGLALALAKTLLRRGTVGAAVDPPQHAFAGASADIGIDAVEIVIAIGAADRAVQIAVERHLARQRNETARTRLAVQHRRRPLDDLDPVEPRHVDLRRQIAGAALQLQAVEELRRIEPAQLELVVHLGARPALFGRHAGDEAERLVEVLQAQSGDVVGGDDADRLRRLGERGVGLGARRRLGAEMLPGDDDDPRILRSILFRSALFRARLRIGHRLREAGGREQRGGQQAGQAEASSHQIPFVMRDRLMFMITIINSEVGLLPCQGYGL